MDRAGEYNKQVHPATAGIPSLPDSKKTQQFATYHVETMATECPQSLQEASAYPVSIPLHLIQLRSCSEMEMMETECLQRLEYPLRLEWPQSLQEASAYPVSIPLHLIKLRSCSEATAPEPTQLDMAAYSMEHLCLYLTEEQKSRVMESARNPDWQSRVDTLLAEGFESTLFDHPDTCQILFCGLVSGKINPDQFMEFYLYLTLRLTFLSDSLQTNPLIGKEALDRATSVKAVRQWDGQLKYEIHLTPKMQVLTKKSQSITFVKQGGCADSSYLAAWLSLFSSQMPGVRLEFDGASHRQPSKLVIDSWQDLVKNAANKAPGGQGLMPLVTFGRGGWEDLKALRQKGYHPVTLWHPMIPGSVVDPGGVWMGALASLRDIYHIGTANTLTPEERATLLMLDSSTLTPSITLAETLCTKKVSELSPADQQFMRGCELMFQELANGLASNYSRSELETEFPDLQTIKQHAHCDRPLIDQEVSSESLLKHYQFHPESVNLYNNKADKLFAVSRLIYLALANKDQPESSMMAKTLKHPLQPYPEVRAKLESLKEPSQQGIMYHLLNHPEDNLKWMIDWWCRFLQGKQD